MSNSILFHEKAIHYSFKGKGKAIILLHGFLESKDLWNQFTEVLSDEFLTVSIDLPGHGASENLKEIHSMDLMAEAVNHIITHLNIGKCVLLGHSLGGYVAMAFAENYPNKLQGLVLFHSQAGADSFDAKVNRERVILLVQKDKTRFIKNYIPELFAPVNVHRFSAEIDKLKEQALLAKKPGIIAALKGMRDRPDRRQVLNDISKPVLFIIGKEDRKIPMQVILDQVSLPQHSEMLLLHHVGHMGMLEAARITSKVVWDFSKRCYSEASMVIK